MAAIIVDFLAALVLVSPVIPSDAEPFKPADFVLAFVIACVALSKLSGWVSFRRQHGKVRSADVQERVVAGIQTPEIPHPEKRNDLLVIRAADDEAGGLLGAARFSGWLGFAAARFTKPALIMLATYGFFGAAQQLDFDGRRPFGLNLGPMWHWYYEWMFIFYSGLALVLAIPMLSGFAHGVDGPSTTRFAIVTAEASPPGDSTIWQLQVRETRANGLAHSSLYDDPDVVARVLAHAVPRMSQRG